VGEGHGRREAPGDAAPKNPPAYRARNGERASVGTGESLLRPAARSRWNVGSYKSEDEVGHLRRGSRRGAYGTDDGDDNTTSPEGRLPALSMRPGGGKSGECRQG